MLNVQEFSNLRIYAALLSNQQISILEYQNCLANFVALIYQAGQIFLLLKQTLLIETGSKGGKCFKPISLFVKLGLGRPLFFSFS